MGQRGRNRSYQGTWWRIASSVARVRKVGLGMDCTRDTAGVVVGMLVDTVDGLIRPDER